MSDQFSYSASEVIQPAEATPEELTYEELCALAEELPSTAFHGDLSPEVESYRQKIAVTAFLLFRKHREALLASLDQLLDQEESTDVEEVLEKYMRDRLDTRASHIFVFAQYYTAPEDGREAILAGALAKLEQCRTLVRIMETAEWFIQNPPATTEDATFTQ